MVIIKPDAIQRSLIGEIIHRYERIGLKLTGMKLMNATSELIEKHYTLDPEWRRITGEKTLKSYVDRGLSAPYSTPYEVTDILLKKLVHYMTSGPLIVMVWQGAHAVEIVRKLTGGTEPLTSDVGTIRGDFVLDSYHMTDADGRSIRNLVHASGSVKEAEDEIKHWFKESELIDYRLVQEQILYDVNMDGKKE
jgi:nucleoside-diphosphate kinase